MAETMEMSLIERAAEALYDAPDTTSGDTIGTVIWNSEHLFYETVEGEEIVDLARRASMPVCRDAVRAVLQAIREPSERMMEAYGAALAQHPPMSGATEPYPFVGKRLTYAWPSEINA